MLVKQRVIISYHINVGRALGTARTPGTLGPHPHGGSGVFADVRVWGTMLVERIKENRLIL
jgi:hypothetical protein